MNKKIITIIFTLSTMLFLVGCSFTNNESNGSDKNYTYNDLDENQKEIIDNVYAELGGELVIGDIRMSQVLFRRVR